MQRHRNEMSHFLRVHRADELIPLSSEIRPVFKRFFCDRIKRFKISQ